MINDDKLLVELKAEHFDIGISEKYDYCEIGLFHLVGIEKTIATVSYGLDYRNSKMFGIPNPPSYVPGTAS